MVILFIKLCVFIAIQYFDIFSRGDAEYYHAYAIGIVDTALNLWPKVLHFLNQFELYNREALKYVLFFLSSVVIPFIIIKVISPNWDNHKNIKWSLLVLISLYPSLFFWSIDIYRDNVMILLFLFGVIFFKKYMTTQGFYNLMIAAMFGVVLIFFRSYLGFSFLIAVFLPKVKVSRFVYYLFFYFFFLVLLYQIGLFAPILSYRGENGFEYGHISMGIGLLHKSWWEFLFLYIESELGQLFGLDVVNSSAIFLFVFETIPYIIGLVYIFRNRQYINHFEKTLLIFSLLYATIWIMGNDNLGTAIRLRMFDYISVFIVTFSLFLKKRNYLCNKTVRKS